MDWKKIGRMILFPPVWLLALQTIAAAAALVWIFLNGMAEQWYAYGIYVLSFYTLVTDCAFLVLVLPKHCRRIKQAVYDNPLGNRYLTDKVFRARVSLYLSLGINLLYVGLQGVQWYLFRSWWFVVLAAYYVILSLMRFLLVRYVHKNEPGTHVLAEWKTGRVCAAILLLVNLSLSAAVLMILYQNRGFDYGGILIYVMALYTFYSTIHAVVDIIKYRKLGSPIMSTAKIVSLSAALVSMLNLETAMFSQFGGDMPAEYQRIFIILTGAGVSIIVVTLSVWLIVRATKEIRRNTDGK